MIPFTTLAETPAPARATASPNGRAQFLARAVAASGAIWIAGMVIGLGLLLVGLLRLRWLAAGARRVEDARWIALADDVAREYGLRRPVTLLHTEHPTLLVTWGVFRPNVLVPLAARDWSPDRIRIVLGHELAHVRRHDWLVQMAAELLRAVYWFNPLLWIACSRLRRESEHACDDAVLNLGVQGTEYASELVDLARTFSRHRAVWSPAPAMARPSSLERRVSFMLNTRLNRAPVSRSAGVVAAVVLVSITLPIAGFRAFAQTGPASLSGSTVDAIGHVLPDCPIVISNVQSKEKYQTRSDSAAHFDFARLPAGEYLIEAEMPGMTASERLTLRAGERLRHDVALQLGSLVETININDTPPPPPPPAPSARSGSAQIAPPAPPPPPQPPSRDRAISEPDVDPCSQSPVGGCITQPAKIHDVKPVYPPNRRGSNVKLELETRIGTDGFVKDVSAVAPADAEFVNAAAEAVRQWRFTQTRLDGVPVEVRMRVHVRFYTVQ